MAVCLLLRSETQAPRILGEPDDRPVKPKGLSKIGSQFWDDVITTSNHLRKSDSEMCRACCELLGLYRTAERKAKKYSGDKEARIAVKDYFEKWKSAMQCLGLDPLGRARIGKNISRGNKTPFGGFGVAG